MVQNRESEHAAIHLNDYPLPLHITTRLNLTTLHFSLTNYHYGCRWLHHRCGYALLRVFASPNLMSHARLYAVRVRPPTALEAARLPEPCYETSFRGDGALSTPAKVVNTATLRDIVQIVDDRILCFDPDEKDKARAFMERGFLPPGTKRYKDKRFMFDRVFGHGARQTEVYEATAQPLLQGLLDGYNATVFAYGVRLLVVRKHIKSLNEASLRQPVAAKRTLSVEQSVILASST